MKFPCKCNAKCQMQWCKACHHWTLEQWRCVLRSDDHASLAIRWTCLVKGALKVSAYQDILDNFMLPTLWEQFEGGPF
ncbi:unnamed protein product, partial [Staurois parvus]